MINDQMNEIYKMLTGYPDQTVETVPTLADAVASTGGAAWTLSAAYSELLSAVNNTKRRMIVGICPSGPTILEEYQIALYLGTTLVASVPVSVATVVGALAPIILPKPIFVDAGTLIQFKSASASGGDSISLKLITVPV
jgi:hypothetical protein